MLYSLLVRIYQIWIRIRMDLWILKYENREDSAGKLRLDIFRYRSNLGWISLTLLRVSSDLNPVEVRPKFKFTVARRTLQLN